MEGLFERISHLFAITDPELSKINIEMAKKQHEKGQKVVYVHIGSIAPQLSRLTKVSLEVATGT